MIRAGVPVALWWGQRDGRGVWKIKELGASPELMVEASHVELDAAHTCANQEGERSLPGGPRGWIEGILLSYEEVKPP